MYREPSFRLVEEPEPKADVPDDFADRLGSEARQATHTSSGAMADGDAVAALLAGCCSGRRYSISAMPLPRAFRRRSRRWSDCVKLPVARSRPLRDVAGLAIDASDLQADPAHQGSSC